MLRQTANGRITFHRGECGGESVITAVAQHGDDFILMAEITPFHPRDYRWPDQPADRGFVKNSDGKRYRLSDVVILAMSPDGIFSVDDEITVKRGEPGWAFFVGHVVAGERPSFSKGEKIFFEVDEQYRKSLSAGHTASHLTSIALNRALAKFWTKEDVKRDALGAPDFDSQAISGSSIEPGASCDTFRMGKSLRKKGFNPEGLRERIDEIEKRVNEIVNEWIKAGTPVAVTSDDDDLLSMRQCTMRIEGKDVTHPCGGTHVSNLSELGRAEVRLSLADEETLRAETRLSTD